MASNARDEGEINEIIPGIYHWRTYHEGIDAVVHSYFLQLEADSCLIDPRVPEIGLEWFESQIPPRYVYLTNRLHYRHCRTFVSRFGAQVFCHRTGLGHFPNEWGVRGFEDGDVLQGGITVRNIDTLCPEETVFVIPLAGGILAFGDALVRDEEGRLSFVEDELMGEEPLLIRRGLVEQLAQCLELDFDHMLFAHGEPFVHGAKRALREFVEDEAARLGLQLRAS